MAPLVGSQAGTPPRCGVRILKYYARPQGNPSLRYREGTDSDRTFIGSPRIETSAETSATGPREVNPLLRYLEVRRLRIVSRHEPGYVHQH